MVLSPVYFYVAATASGVTSVIRRSTDRAADMPRPPYVRTCGDGETHRRLEGRFAAPAPVEKEFFQRWELGADGLVARVREYESQGPALDAVRLKE
jgi:hypothetical protein